MGRVGLDWTTGDRRRGRRAAAAAAVIALGATLGAGPWGAGPSSAGPSGAGPSSAAATAAEPGATAGEVVVPAAARAVPRATQILNAGETGFLWIREGSDELLWTAYATGATTALPQKLSAPVKYDVDTGYFSFLEASFASFQVADTHTDTVALAYAEPTPHVTLTTGGRTRTVDIPAGRTYQQVYGETVVTTDGNGTYHLISDGADRPVSGLPADAAEVSIATGDATSFILRYRTGEGVHWSIVDIATGTATGLPDRYDGSTDDWEVSGFKLAPDALIRLRSGRSAVDVYDRRELSATPRTVDAGSFSHQADFGVVGDALLGVEPVSPGDNTFRGQPLWVVRNDDATRLMDPAAHQIVQLPDGSALVAGAEKYVGEGDLDWGFYRVSQAADGTVVRARITTIPPMPARVYGLSLGSGILTTATDSTIYQPGGILGAYRSTWLASSGAPAVRRSTVDGLVTGRDGFCYAGSARCVRMFADGTGSHGRQMGTEDNLTMLRANGDPDWGPSVRTGAHNPELTDLSGRWGVVRPAARGAQYIVEFPGATAGGVRQRRDEVAAAVWGSVLFSGAAEGGKVTANNGESFTTANGCTPSELQAVGRFVYYTCVDYWGDAHGSGVHDRVARRTTTVADGPVLLGDGYLARYTAADGLTVTDLAAGTRRVLVPASTMTADSRVGYDWTVDRFGGGVAYADPAEQVHVLPSGVPAAPLAVIDSVVVAGRGTWWLSKPASSWQLVLHDATGATIRTISGSDARGSVTATWTAAGVTGWTLTARPADGRGAALTVTTVKPAVKATKAPAVSGTVAVGSTIRATAGTWSPAPTGYAYRWAANGVAVKGATGSSLPVTAALLGRRLTVTVTASRTGHRPGTATSAATVAVARGTAPRATRLPAVGGTAKADRTVRAAVGAWSPTADSYRYEWRLNGTPVRGASGPTLTLTAAMHNRKLTVTVIARKNGYADGRSTSRAVTVRR